mgnify:CR=1 FL=1
MPRLCGGFFEFTFFDWPVFNVADIYVVAGVILMVLLIVFVLKDEDLDLKKKRMNEMEIFYLWGGAGGRWDKN